MNYIHLSNALSTAELQGRMKSSKDISEHTRWHALYLISAFKQTAQQVADNLAISKETVNKWVHNYNYYGEQSIYSHQRGGRRTAFLSWKEEEDLLAELLNQAEQGLIVIVKALKQEIEKRLDRTLSKDYAYDLLHRHGWRKVSPRPRHPKQDLAAQEEYKKTPGVTGNRQAEF